LDKARKEEASWDYQTIEAKCKVDAKKDEWSFMWGGSET